MPYLSKIKDPNLQSIQNLPKVVMLGAGNLATHLSKALQNAGFDIVQIYSRSECSAKELADLLQTQYITNIDQILSDASLYIISVSDDAIHEVAVQLPLSGQLVVHTAGSIPIDVLSGKLQNYGVLYPLQTFSKSRPIDFTEIPIFLEANSLDNLEQLKQIAGKISSKVYQATSEERKYLHLAAVFGCNFVNYLYNVSAQIAQREGFDFGILSPLILETASKAISSGNPQMIQTGPAIRNDQKVMLKHLELLANHPEWQKIYALLSQCIGQQKSDTSTRHQASS